MAPRAFDRYMVSIGMGTHPKLAALTDAEFRAHVVGVLAVAAMAPVRGRLLVGSLPAEPIHIARAAGVTEKAAASALRKLICIGVLTPDPEHDCLRVHDWDDVNPSPGAERTRRWRDGKRDGGVTPERHGERHKDVTAASPEVEGEEEVPASTTSQQVARKRVTRRVDQSKPPEELPSELLPVVDAVLAVLHRTWDQKGGIEPMVRGVALGILRNPRADHVKVAHSLEHWLIAGRGQRAQCKDIAARFADWVADEGAAPLRVLDGGRQQPEAIRNMNRWKRAPQEAS